MKKWIFVLVIFVISCNTGNQSEEQREAIREQHKNRKPVKISEEQILTKAYDEARRDLKDTVVTQYMWKSFMVKPADSVLIELWEAYNYAVENKIIPDDNVQMLDSVIIYSKPVIKNDSLKNMLIAYIPKKTIVLKLTDQ